MLVALAAIALSAVAFGLYAKVELPWMLLGFVGFVPWILVLDRVASARGAAAAGVAMCVAFSFAIFGWFADAIAGYAETSRGLAWLLLALGAPTLQPQIAVFAIARCPLRRDLGPVLGSVGAALAYVGVEWLWPKVFADTIGHGLHASEVLRQGAELVGAPGLTFLLLCVNECVAASVSSATRDRARSVRALAAAAAAVTVLAAYGAWRLEEQRHDAATDAERPITAALVQASITGYEQLRRTRGTFGAVEWIIDEHVALTAAAVDEESVDLVVWPETVYPTTFGRPKSEAGHAFDDEIESVVGRTGVPLILGSYDVEGADEYNAAFLVEPASASRGPAAAYRKTHLFPLTEYVPWWLESAWARSTMPWLGTWTAGSGPRVLDVRLRDGRTLRAAPLICLDAVVADHAIDAVAGGARVLVTLSNDSWFAETPGARLHLIVSAFRSIETRTPQLRVTNSGISAIIAADGELLATTAVGERTALVGRIVPGGDRATLMLRWGDWFGKAAFAGSLLFAALAFFRGRARSS